MRSLTFVVRKNNKNMKLLITRNKVKDISKSIADFFSESEITKLGKETGFIKRVRKLTAKTFLNMLVIGSEPSGSGMSLSQMVVTLSRQDVYMKDPSLSERFTKQAEAFMKGAFEIVLTKSLSSTPVLQTLEGFTEVRIQDSTTIKLPDALKGHFPGTSGVCSKSSMKLDFQQDLKSGAMKFEVRTGVMNDATAEMGTIKSGSLWLRDLGYFSSNSLKRIAEGGAYYVSRLKCSSNIYALKSDNQPIDIKEIGKKMKENEIVEMEVYIGDKDRIPTRLILQKVPSAEASRRKKKLTKHKKRKGKKMSKQRLEWCEFNVMITNVCKKTYGGQAVFNLYKIRWSIEIIFKVWKSIFQIEKISTPNKERLMCQLYGKLIYIILNQKLFAILKAAAWNNWKIDLSEIKVFKAMVELKSEWQAALISNSVKKYENYIIILCKVIKIIGEKHVRKKKKNQLLHLSDSAHHEPISA